MATAVANRSCSIGDCHGPMYARGWCNRHYKRWLTYGDPTSMRVAARESPPHERFWFYVYRGDGCWLWRGALTGSGYGLFFNGRRSVGAHRFSYELHNGAIPDGLHLDHLCRTPACVNPAHLEPVTSQINTLRGVGPSAENAVKTHCPRGHKYTPENTRTRRDYPTWRECKQCARMRETAKRKVAK